MAVVASRSQLPSPGRFGRGRDGNDTGERSGLAVVGRRQRSGDFGVGGEHRGHRAEFRGRRRRRLGCRRHRTQQRPAVARGMGSGEAADRGQRRRGLRDRGVIDDPGRDLAGQSRRAGRRRGNESAGPRSADAFHCGAGPGVFRRALAAQRRRRCGLRVGLDGVVAGTGRAAAAGTARGIPRGPGRGRGGGRPDRRAGCHRRGREGVRPVRKARRRRCRRTCRSGRTDGSDGIVDDAAAAVRHAAVDGHVPSADAGLPEFRRTAPVNVRPTGWAVHRGRVGR